jgi:AAHS family 4-hydroxybenzoate transporter-like MFS transporter
MDGSRIRPIHFVVLAICLLTAITDGLDNQVIGYSAPAIATDLGVPFSDFGLVFSSGLTGTLIGAAVLGRLGDRIGRRWTLIICTTLFGALTAVIPLARNVAELSALRFAGGLGMGGAMPCFLTLVSEYAPSTRKAFATGLLWCGYPAGGMTAALIGSQLLSREGGWRAMFYIGGGLALVVASIQFLLLPESLQFLVLNGRNPRRLKRLAARLAPDRDLQDVQFVTGAPVGERAKVTEIFADGRAIATVLLWIALLMTFMLASFLVLWLPGLLKTSGIPIATTALLLALSGLATLPSQAAAGYFLDRVGPWLVLPLTYGALAITVGVLAFSSKVILIVAIAVVLIAFLQGPGIAGTLFLTTSIYPSRVRSTGVGLAMSIGRGGQVVGTLLVGGLVARGVSVSTTILTMSAAPGIALISVALLGLSMRARRVG